MGAKNRLSLWVGPTKILPFILLIMTVMKISIENTEDREREKQLRKGLNPKWLVAVSPFAYLNDTIEIAKFMQIPTRHRTFCSYTPTVNSHTKN